MITKFGSGLSFSTLFGCIGSGRSNGLRNLWGSSNKLSICQLWIHLSSSQGDTFFHPIHSVMCLISHPPKKKKSVDCPAAPAVPSLMCRPPLSLKVKLAFKESGGRHCRGGTAGAAGLWVGRLGISAGFSVSHSAFLLLSKSASYSESYFTI